MKIYRVGGCIRDEIMGLTPHDTDYVIVGSTPEEMLALGYSQVGKDFPVFLHPETNEEYALARKERKTGFGHTDFETIFDPSVTIEEDLQRRDLTINAIANPHNFEGEMVDPFGGIEDLKNGVLRHVSEAFKEDPLRVLRLARFHSRFGFEVHQTTIDMCKEMVANGDIEHISKERIFAEFKKALNGPNVYKFHYLLKSVGLNYCKPNSNWRLYRSMDEGQYDNLLTDEQKIMVKLSWLFARFDFAELKSQMKALSIPTDYIQFCEDAHIVRELYDYLDENRYSTDEFEIIPILRKINWPSRIMKTPNYLDIMTKIYADGKRTKRIIEAYIGAQKTVQQFIDEYTVTEGEMPSGKLINAHIMHMQSVLVKQLLCDITETRKKFWNSYD